MQTTFPRLMLDHAAKRPTAPALREKVYGIWQTLTWADLAMLVRDLAGDRQMPFPKSTPPFDADLAAALADQLHESAPGPRRSIEKYVAYLGGYRCRELADLAVELAAHPEWPVADVHARLVSLGWNATGLAEAQPAIDPRVSVYGPRTIGGVWFQLLSKWVGPRLAGWIERQR